MDCVFVILSRIPAAAAVVKNAIAASIDVNGSKGSLRALATSSEPLAVLDVPLIAG